MNRAKPVRVLSANLHTTSRAPLVVPWLWRTARRHRVDVMTLQEVTGWHAFWLRKRPGWVLIQRRPFAEAIYARRKHTTARRVLRPVSAPWARKRRPGYYPGRSLPLATLRGWLVVGSVHFPPSWSDHGAPTDRMHAGSGMALALLSNLPQHVPLYLDGDWNADPFGQALVNFRESANLPLVRGRRIIHAAARRVDVGRRRSVGRARGMDHDAYLTEVAP